MRGCHRTYDSQSVSQESGKAASETDSVDSSETKDPLAAQNRPAVSDGDSLQCAFPCCAVEAPDLAESADTTACQDEYPEMGKPLPEEIELPYDHFALSIASSEVSVAELEPLDLDGDPELTLEEAVALCGDRGDCRGTHFH